MQHRRNLTAEGLQASSGAFIGKTAGGHSWAFRWARRGILIALASLPLGGCVAVGLLEWAGEEVHCQPTGFFACPPARAP